MLTDTPQSPAFDTASAVLLPAALLPPAEGGGVVLEQDESADIVPAGEPEVIGGRHSPLRRCIVTGTVAGKDGMLRFAVAPDGTLVPDLEESLPGRGLWLTADRAVLEKAVAKNLFARAARRAVRVDRDLVRLVLAGLTRRCLDLIGLARKGGGAVAGFEKVQAALRTNRVGTAGAVGLWLEARDGSADGRHKLAGMAESLRVPLIDRFDRGELGSALGRDEAVHAVLAAGPLVSRLRREVTRLVTLEPFGPAVKQTATLSDSE
jgi:uncharacterized protein